MRNIIYVAVFGAASLLAGTAVAEQNWYIGAEGALTFNQKSGLSGLGSAYDGDVSYKHGYLYGGVIGYDFGGFRLEGEVAHRNSKAKDFTIRNDGGIGLASGTGVLAGNYDATGGAANITSGMANAYIDFGKDWVVHPYIGAGIGVAAVKFGDLRVGPAVMVQGLDHVMAYQGIVGLRWKISDAVDLVTDYRYFATGHLNVGDGRDFGMQVDKYRSHTVMVGLHFKFGGPAKHSSSVPMATATPAPAPVAEPTPAPAPPVQEPPAAPPARQVVSGPFVVYFAWDRSTLNADAIKVVREAAEALRDHGSAQIVLRSHSDTSGKKDYNLALSQKRGDNVRKKLINEGVKAERIVVDALGETDLVVPTANGVRDPQNRVVQITVEQ